MCTIFWLEKLEGKRPLGRSGRRWEVIRMDLGEIGWKDVEWIHVSEDSDQWRVLVNTVMNLRVTYKAGNLTR
jgi:hypothetical protein